MKSFKELVIGKMPETPNLEEKVTWNHAEVAIQDVFNDLKSSGYNVKKSGNNGLKIIHDNGCVGTVVFDPSLKESMDEYEEEWNELNKDREFKHPIIPSKAKSKYAGKENPEEIIIYVGKQKESMIYNKRVGVFTLYAPSGAIYKECTVKPDEIKQLAKLL